MNRSAAEDPQPGAPYDERYVAGLIAEVWNDVRRVVRPGAWSRVTTLGPEFRRPLEDDLRRRGLHVPGFRLVPQIGLFAGARPGCAVWIDRVAFPNRARSILVAQAAGDPRWLALSDNGLACIATRFTPTAHRAEAEPRTARERKLEDLRLTLPQRRGLLAHEGLAMSLTRAQVAVVAGGEVRVVARLDAGAVLVLKRGSVVLRHLDREGRLLRPTRVRFADSGFELPARINLTRKESL